MVVHLRKPREAEILSPSEHGNFSEQQSLDVVYWFNISDPFVYDLSEVVLIHLFMTDKKSFSK